MPRVSRAETRSPAFTKNFDGSRPEIATLSSASNFAADIEMLIWKLAGLRSSPSPGRRNEDDRSDRLVLVAPALLLALANAQETRRRFQPAAYRERDRFAFGDDDPHDQDALAPLLDDEPRLGRLEGDERHG